MIIEIPKDVLKEFKCQWRDCVQKHIQFELLDEIIFTSNGYVLNSKFKPTKDKAPKDYFVLTLTMDAFIPIQVGALDLRGELLMLNTSILADLKTKSYARQLYELYNPTFKPVSLTFPELRFLWNYIRAYVSILYANEGNDFNIDTISKQFLEGLSTMPLAKPSKIPEFKPQHILNNYQTWYDSSMYGTRWQDYVDAFGVVDFYDDLDDFDDTPIH
jgi:hypothetical protein